VYVPSEAERIRERAMKGWSPPGTPLFTKWLVTDPEGNGGNGRVLWEWDW